MSSSKIKIYAITLFIFEEINNKLITETFVDYIKKHMSNKKVILIHILAHALKKNNIYKNCYIYAILFEYINSNPRRCFRSLL